MTGPWLPATTEQLGDWVKGHGLHLHNHAHGLHRATWRMVLGHSRNAICGTERCFKLKLKTVEESKDA